LRLLEGPRGGERVVALRGQPQAEGHHLLHAGLSRGQLHRPLPVRGDHPHVEGGEVVGAAAGAQQGLGVDPVQLQAQALVAAHARDRPPGGVDGERERRGLAPVQLRGGGRTPRRLGAQREGL
ncbi:MAG: hypothetical protein ACK559_25740, partial [bacterium]